MRIYWRNPEIDVDDLAKACKGYEQPVIDNIVTYLPKRKQKMFELYSQPLSKKEMEKSQLIFVKLARTMNDSGEINLEDVKDWLKEEREQLWVIVDEQDKEIIGALTTQIYIYPNQKHLHLHLCGAKPNTMYKWIGVWEKPVKEFCKENNISYIETAGRDGWTRVLQNKGYKKYYTVLVKEIKND